MLTNADITVYHYDEETEKYVRTPLYGVHLYEQDGFKDEKGGFVPDRRVLVRVISDEPITVGDYVRKGISESKTPDKSACFKVTSVTDNRESRILPHRKLVCI